MEVITTNLGEVKLFKRGKVRDIYDLEDKLLIIATDRISAFDYVLPTPIPLKGKVLTGLSIFWFNFLKDIIPSHFLTGDIELFPSSLKPYYEILKGRSILAKKAKPLPVECVVRGYLAGSAWQEYQEKGEISGIKLPKGLKEAEKLPEPIFTPATKAEEGHDINITFSEMAKIVGEGNAAYLKETSLRLYKKATRYAEEKGIIIADTKFEFGYWEREVILIDEVLTPDSSRFWDKETYKIGSSPPSFDKQFVRDYLIKIGWDKKPPAPELPAEIVEKTKEKYLTAYERLVGKPLREGD
ncbi:MAG: phosphoribosylaminoimidazolesuccinocarboxamide synthase [candidate division WOR-3 bacterium]